LSLAVVFGLGGRHEAVEPAQKILFRHPVKLNVGMGLAEGFVDGGKRGDGLRLRLVDLDEDENIINEDYIIMRIIISNKVKEWQKANPVTVVKEPRVI
jgi:hypothetical protein